MVKERVIELNTGTPVLEGRDGYFASYLGNRTQMGNLLSNSESISDARIRDFVEFIISGIVDEKIRNEIYTSLDTDIKKAIEEENPEDNEDRARIERRTCIRYLGKVSTWYDNMLGVCKQNVWGVIRAPDSVPE